MTTRSRSCTAVSTIALLVVGVVAQSIDSFTCPDGAAGFRNRTGMYCPSYLGVDTLNVPRRGVTNNQFKYVDEQVASFRCSADPNYYYANDLMCQGWCDTQCGGYTMPQPATPDSAWLRCFTKIPEGCIVTFQGETTDAIPLSVVEANDLPSEQWQTCSHWSDPNDPNGPSKPSKPCCKFDSNGIPVYDLGCCYSLGGQQQCNNLGRCLCDGGIITLRKQMIVLGFPFQIIPHEAWASGFGRRTSQKIDGLYFYKKRTSPLASGELETNSSRLNCRGDNSTIQFSEQFGYTHRMMQIESSWMNTHRWRWEFSNDTLEYGINLTHAATYYAGTPLSKFPKNLVLWLGEYRVGGIGDAWDGWNQQDAVKFGINPQWYIFTRCYIDQYGNITFLQDAEQFYMKYSWESTFESQTGVSLSHGYPDYTPECGSQESCTACHEQPGCYWCMTAYGQTCSAACKTETELHRRIYFCEAFGHLTRSQVGLILPIIVAVWFWLLEDD